MLLGACRAPAEPGVRRTRAGAAQQRAQFQRPPRTTQCPPGRSLIAAGRNAARRGGQSLLVAMRPPASGMEEVKPVWGSAVPALPSSLPCARSGAHLSAGELLLRSILPATPAQQRGRGGETQTNSGAIKPL